MPTALRTKRVSTIRLQPAGLPGTVVGRLVGRSAIGEPMVEFPGNPTDCPVPARSTTDWNIADIGSEVALVFESGRPTAPIILGVIRSTSPAHVVQLSADGQKLTLTAGREIELRCGKASITLTSAGKVLIRGEYVLSRSAGVNRVKGAAVEIN